MRADGFCWRGASQTGHFEYLRRVQTRVQIVFKRRKCVCPQTLLPDGNRPAGGCQGPCQILSYISRSYVLSFALQLPYMPRTPAYICQDWDTIVSSSIPPAHGAVPFLDNVHSEDRMHISILIEVLAWRCLPWATGIQNVSIYPTNTIVPSSRSRQI